MMLCRAFRAHRRAMSTKSLHRHWPPAHAKSIRLKAMMQDAVLQSKVAGQFLLDPSADESFGAEGNLLLAMMASSNQVGAVSFMYFDPVMPVWHLHFLFVTDSAGWLGLKKTLVQAPPCGMQVSGIVLTGEHNSEQITHVIELAMGGCQQLDGVMRQCLRDAVVTT